MHGQRRLVSAWVGDNVADSMGAAGVILYCAGVPWDTVEGTDHRLVEQLARTHRVLWVDPTRPWRSSRHSTRLTRLQERIWRLAPVGPPGVTRLAMRNVAQWRLPRLIGRALDALDAPAVLAIVSNPFVDLSSLNVPRTLFFATDDFMAGSELTGTSRRAVTSLARRNLLAADVTLAVSPTLVDTLRHLAPTDIRLFPNGCAPERFDGSRHPAPEVNLEGPRAGLVGQLNDRLDVALLEAVVETGSRLLIVGPEVFRDEGNRRRFSALATSSNVQWVGPQPYSRVPDFVTAMNVGLTPYLDTDFNRSSFPLKTLEYLSAGVPVISTDLPSSRWLDTEVVRCVQHHEFASEVAIALSARPNPSVWHACRLVASRHSWSARADELLRIGFG